MFLNFEERVALDLVEILDHNEPTLVRTLARRVMASPAATRKVMQKLVRAGYAKSKSGPGGGYTRDNLRLLDASVLDILLLFRNPGASVRSGLSNRIDDIILAKLQVLLPDVTRIGLKS
jgi:DNA-binding IscR family transcriptional regulator